MIHRARALAFLGSVALHAAAVAAVLALVAGLRQPEPLFIDLTGGSEAADGRAARAAEPPADAAKAPPARGAGRSHAKRMPPPEPAVPSRPVETAPVPAPASSTSASTAPAERPVASPPAETSAATTSTAVGSATAATTTSGRSAKAAASDAPASVGESHAPIGGSGSRLALADPGTGRGDIPPEFGPYFAGFRQRLQKSLVYPLVARRRGLEGRVEIELVLEPSGRVRDVAVVLSSSYALLDDAAVEAVKSIPPEPLPVQSKRQTLRVRLPVVFQLQQ